MSIGMYHERTPLQVHLQPNAKKDEIVGFDGQTIKIRIVAQPVKGKANKALIQFLSKVFDLPKSAITIEKGLTSKQKTILVEGITQDEIVERITNNLIQNRK